VTLARLVGPSYRVGRKREVVEHHLNVGDGAFDLTPRRRSGLGTPNPAIGINRVKQSWEKRPNARATLGKHMRLPPTD
jgi:hypothetical protein